MQPRQAIGMLSRCANPNCATPLRRLRDGRLFQFAIKCVSVTGLDRIAVEHGRQERRRSVWHFWLCGDCSSNMTLEFDQLKGLKIKPLQGSYYSLVS